MDADRIAKEIKAPKSSNIIMVGAASPFLGIKKENLERAIHILFAKKGEKVVNSNLIALKAGEEAVADKV